MNKTTQDAVNQYELLNPLLTGIYKEMLKMENTHAFLDVLDVDEMPTNSDVVLVFNHS